ncbi:hypothetical protein Dimus_023182 [Dionaea muscipula]
MNKLGAGSHLAEILVVVVVVALLQEAALTNAVTCSVTELSPCAAALLSSSPPSSACCNKINEQKPCLCGYSQDPNIGRYVNSPAARKVATTCGVGNIKC